MVDSRPGIASAESIACPPVCVVGPPVSDGVASKSCRVGGGRRGGFLPAFQAEPRMPADAARIVVGCKPAIFIVCLIFFDLCLFE